jgi:hypothetical protein
MPTREEIEAAQQVTRPPLPRGQEQPACRD